MEQRIVRWLPVLAYVAFLGVVLTQIEPGVWAPLKRGVAEIGYRYRRGQHIGRQLEWWEGLDPSLREAIEQAADSRPPRG